MAKYFEKMREYVRVPIPVPTGVLLCAYKLGFGLVQNYLEDFKIPSVWAHWTVPCAPDSAMSGAPAMSVQIQLCASLSGGSPDSYCALSCVHRSRTVDCPVCP
jgi:hypothetical protein